jgi:hypothetical protein
VIDRSGDRKIDLLYVGDVARDPYVRLDSESEVTRPGLRDEARRLAANLEDRAEMKTLREELDELLPVWPAD